MDHVLDILCDYSLKNKEVDIKFLKHVFNILKVDKEDYVKKIKTRIYNNPNVPKNSRVPMAYSYFQKTIFVHSNEVVASQKFLQNNVGSWSDLDRMFLLNTYCLSDLVHEFEHVDQFDKIMNSDGSIDSKLLGLTHLSYRGVKKESEFNQFLINHFGIWLNDNLGDIHSKLARFNRDFGRDILYERIADIRATEKINHMLESVDYDINGTKNFFSISLIQNILKGYNFELEIPFPMVRYINEIRSLGIPEINEYIDEVVLPCIYEVLNGYDRLVYGLFAMDEEIDDLKKILV